MIGRPFTPAEDAQIRALLAEGLRAYAISLAIGRNHTSVSRRVEHLTRKPGRLCKRCGRAVLNDAATDYRHCDACRAVITHAALGITRAFA